MGEFVVKCDLLLSVCIRTLGEPYTYVYITEGSSFWILYIYQLAGKYTTYIVPEMNVKFEVPTKLSLSECFVCCNKTSPWTIIVFELHSFIEIVHYYVVMLCNPLLEQAYRDGGWNG